MAITPKKYLHDAISHHAHTYVNTQNGDVVSKAGFNCQVDELVVSTSFNNAISLIEINTIVIHNVYSSFYAFTNVPAAVTQQYLRGPPALV